MRVLRLALIGMMLVVAAMAATRAIPVYAEQPPAAGKMHHCQDCPDCDDTTGGGCDMTCAVACSSFIAADFAFAPALTFVPVETFSAVAAPLVALSRPPPLQPPIP